VPGIIVLADGPEHVPYQLHQTNFTSILSTLAKALNGQGDLLVMDYYDPYQNLCPNTVPYLNPTLNDSFNAHIANDASACTYNGNVPCNVHVAYVFNAFGGATTPNPYIYTYTWMNQDIHPSTQGYSVIAGAYETTYGY
jgi:hypothetical protein